MSIPAGTRFIGILPGVDMTERKSAQANSPSNVYTIEDIQDGSVPDTRTITINGTTQDLSANRSWTISTGLTVGTTAVTSGTDGRVFFQAGGVVQQDANFTFDNTLKRLALKAVGTAGTDIPFQIKNSAGTQNLLQVSGKAITLNGPGGTAFTPCIDLQRNGSSIFFIDEYAAKFNGPAYFSSIVGYGSTAISVSSQSGPPGQAITLYPASSGLSLGYSSTAARLDVRAQGALSTDIAFRVRNSADTANLGQINGDGTFRFGDANGGLNSSVSLITDGRLFLSKSGSNFIELNPSAANRLYSTNGWQFEAVGTGKYLTFVANGATRMRIIDGTIQIGSFNTSDNATNTMYFLNGTAPNTNHTDIFKIYSADIVAGNAAPHFRTENGNIIKLYQQSSAGIATVGDLVTVLQNLGLLS